MLRRFVSRYRPILRLIGLRYPLFKGKHHPDGGLAAGVRAIPF
jgi:hypothetical protein